MAKHSETGLNGERIAENFLKEKGYVMLHRNWRVARREVDLIALKDDVVVFVEVKTRTRQDYGYPEEAVGKKKMRLLKEAAEFFMLENLQYQKAQFDLVSITIWDNGEQEIMHFEDAFY